MYGNVLGLREMEGAREVWRGVFQTNRWGLSFRHSFHFGCGFFYMEESQTGIMRGRANHGKVRKCLFGKGTENQCSQIV